MESIKSLVLSHGFFEYEFKPAELVFAFIQGAAGFVVATTVAPLNGKDWQTYAIAVAAAGARAAFVLVFGARPSPAAIPQSSMIEVPERPAASPPPAPGV